VIKSWEIIHYISRRGEQPVSQFIHQLDPISISKIIRMVGVLSQKGYEVRMPYSKQLDNNLYELRIRGKREIRIFYCFKVNKIVLLHGFVKKTQKTPDKEINTATSRLNTI